MSGAEGVNEPPAPTRDTTEVQGEPVEVVEPAEIVEIVEIVDADVLDELDGSTEAAAVPPAELTVEDLVALVETLTAERDEATDARMRLQAEFENYRKRASKQELELRERASESLVTKLLPALDALESGRVQGIEGLEGVHGVLWSALEREGLAVVNPVDQPFDPNEHEAVLHEAGEGGPEVVSETLRAGYSWKGRVLRPAMVKVRT